MSKKTKSIRDMRKTIDSLDKRIVTLLNQRAQTALTIGKNKAARQAAVYVPAREREVLENVQQHNKGPLSDKSLLAVYREIMSGSLALEGALRIAYLGPEATFTHQAARNRFGSSVQYTACETITDVFNAVHNHHADYGVVPIENSIEGAVTHTLDEFAASPLKVCAEIYLEVAHHLMATRLDRKFIRRIYSKDQVFGQCRNWLRQNMPGIDLAPVSSTARAAEMASREKNTAALAGLLASELYGLHVLARNIQDYGANTTRFLVLGFDAVKPSGHDKTSILFSVKHRAGALHQVLSIIKRHRINMTKIESRPSRQKAWEYLFFMDIEGHTDEPHIARALTEMEKYCTVCTVLGAYPRAPEISQ